jgi:hypothetical protein
MFIAAFDLATATGVCHGTVGGVPHVWTWFLSDSEGGRPVKLAYLRRLLDKYFESTIIDAVYYEAPMPLRAMMERGASEDVIALLRGSIGVLESCAAHAGIQTIEAVSVQRARTALIGRQTRSKIKGAGKEAVQRVAKMMGVAVTDDHQADAYACWFYACAKNNPRLAHISTPLFARQT